LLLFSGGFAALIGFSPSSPAPTPFRAGARSAIEDLRPSAPEPPVIGRGEGRADADERIEDEPPAVDDAVVAALVEIEKLRQARRYQAALDRSKALLKSHPRVAVAHLVYGNIYFDRMWWRDGFAAYTEAIALDSGLAGHPTVIANAIRGLSSRSRPWLAERFIRDHIGAAAIEPLEEEARTTKSKSLRQRALRLAGQIRKGG
jgi:hypothetical protein